jgi:hypothetical protein
VGYTGPAEATPGSAAIAAIAAVTAGGMSRLLIIVSGLLVL